MTSAWIGALTSDMKNPADAIPAKGTSQGAGSASEHSDVIWKMNAIAPRVSGSTRRTMRIDANAPISAPPPSAPKSQPRMRGFAWYWLTTSTGKEANSSCQQTSTIVNAGVHRRSNLSRTRKRTPAKTPPASDGAGTSGGCTNAATSANETRYVAAST